MNIAILIGRLTADPELRHTPNDIPVTTFCLAIDRPYKSGEEKQTDFINVTAWRKTAEFVTKYFKKGQRAEVVGSIQTRKYTDKDGKPRTAFEVVADNVHFVDPKGSGAPSSPAESSPATFSNADPSDFSEISGDDDLPF